MHVHWFAVVVLTRMSFLSLIYRNIKMLLNVYHQTLEVDIEKQLYHQTLEFDIEKQFWCLFIDWVALFFDEFHSLKPLGMKQWYYSINLVLLSVYCWHGFCFGFHYKFEVCMTRKKVLYLFTYINESIKSTVFAMSIISAMNRV